MLPTSYDNLALTTSHACLCGLAVAARELFQQCRGALFACIRMYCMCMHYIAFANNLRFSIVGTYVSGCNSDDVTSVTDRRRSAMNSVGLTHAHPIMPRCTCASPDLCIQFMWQTIRYFEQFMYMCVVVHCAQN